MSIVFVKISFSVLLSTFTETAFVFVNVQHMQRFHFVANLRLTFNNHLPTVDFIFSYFI